MSSKYLQDYLAQQMKAGRVLEWRRVEPRVGARLQVKHPYDLPNDALNDLRNTIAGIEGCEPEFVELLPCNASGGSE